MSYTVNPGNLNKRVTILKLSHVSDGGGGYKDEPVPIKDVWADIYPVSGREFWEAQQTQASISHKIVIRYREDIDRTCSIKYKNRIFDVQYTKNISEDNKYLEITAQERQ